MTKRLDRAGLQVDTVLVRFVEDEALPGSGIEAGWRLVERPLPQPYDKGSRYDFDDRDALPKAVKALSAVVYNILSGTTDKS